MDIRVELDERGLIPDRFAKHADAKYLYANTPTRSFPIEIVDIPNEAKSIALTFFDYDSIPVCGFAWIHWAVCGIDAGEAKDGVLKLPEDASNRQSLGMVQGRNSSASRLFGGSTDPLLTCRYNGPQPPDKTHVYTLRAYALDFAPQLEEGFWLNELMAAMRGRIIARAEKNLPARASAKATVETVERVGGALG